ncbi:GNAT family N-acetyltransferase [Streptomyces sp. NPDC046465]|uniref:GNAT family N-acetyltransferase n=1 Tax=Streptomyces sp. NPDC046465 TaxID=3155810 RepID=UPI003400B831
MERSAYERELLALEVEVIHGLVPGRGGELPTVTDPSVLAVQAWSPGACVRASGAKADGWGARRSDGCEAPVGTEQRYAPGEPPDILVRLAAARAGAGDPAELRGGPCFTFPPRPADDFPWPLPLLLSDAEGRRAARRLTRPDNWQPGEWAELISGAAGEWAMAVRDGEPVSICHTPAANDRAAEAGVWTRPDFRGRGLAPAVTDAWARREGCHRQTLFYSTTADNHASRAVARKLGLTPLGWIWTVRRAPARTGSLIRPGI